MGPVISKNNYLKVQSNLTGYLFILVPVVSSIVFFFGPMIISFFWSFTDYNGVQKSHFVGLKNYVKLFTNDDVFLKSVWNTTKFTIITMTVGPALGLLTALMLNTNVRLRAFFRTAYFIPVMTSLVVVSVLWKMLYAETGIINEFLMKFAHAEAVDFLGNVNLSLLSISIASIWQGFGYETVIFLAALQAIPHELYEAAEVDGATGIHKFLYITIPQLKPVMAFVFTIGIIGGYQVYDQIQVMTTGGPDYSSSSIVFYLFSAISGYETRVFICDSVSSCIPSDRIYYCFPQIV